MGSVKDLIVERAVEAELKKEVKNGKCKGFDCRKSS
jgi:hypothetical protein